MQDKLVTQIVQCYTTGKKVQRALRLVKKPRLFGLLSIAALVGGRSASKDGGISRKKVGEKERGSSRGRPSEHGGRESGKA